MSGLYAADGSINVTVVNGATVTGLYAANGSWNVVESNGTVYGAYHPCGALYVTLDNTGPNSIHAPDGSINVTTTPYAGTGALKVTVVSGAFGGGGGGTDAIYGTAGFFGTWS